MSFGGIYKFSDILSLKSKNADFAKGCIVDTSILFAISYPNDLYNESAEQLFEFLSEIEMPAFTNVNIRAEFIQNQFQVMVPEGLSDFYSQHGKSQNQIMYKKLQSNYTMITDSKNKGTSYKFTNSKVSEWRNFLRENYMLDTDAWFDFCQLYINHRIEEIWESTCDDVGVNFLSLRGSDSKDWMTGPIDWKDASLLVGKFGIGSFDAMIINLFLNSHFPAIVTADKEIAKVINYYKQSEEYLVV